MISRYQNYNVLASPEKVLIFFLCVHILVCFIGCKSHFVSGKSSWCESIKCTSSSKTNCVNIISVSPVWRKIVEVSTNKKKIVGLIQKETEVVTFLLHLWLEDPSLQGNHYCHTWQHTRIDELQDSREAWL